MNARSGIWSAAFMTALSFATTSAHADWRGYYCKDGVGFSFTAPGELKREKSAYSSKMAGRRDAVVFTSREDDVEFQIIVVGFPGRASDENALIKEASGAYIDRAKVLLDTDARVESTYGRKLTIDLPDNGGRSMNAIFFKDNHLIQLRANVLPGGDSQSASMGRFVDSLAFYDSYKDDNATELKLSD
jgi:hypothetical protein